MITRSIIQRSLCRLSTIPFGFRCCSAEQEAVLLSHHSMFLWKHVIPISSFLKTFLLLRCISSFYSFFFPNCYKPFSSLVRFMPTQASSPSVSVTALKRVKLDEPLSQRWKTKALQTKSMVIFVPRQWTKGYKPENHKNSSLEMHRRLFGR